MENSVQNPMYKFSTTNHHLSRESHNDIRCATSNDSIREELRNLTMVNNSTGAIAHWENNNETTGFIKQPPKLRMISNNNKLPSSSPSSSSENVNVTSISNNKSKNHYATTATATSSLNGAPPPRLIPISATSTGSIDSNISRSNNNNNAQPGIMMDQLALNQLNNLNLQSGVPNNHQLANTISQLNNFTRSISLPGHIQTNDHIIIPSSISDPTVLTHTTSNYVVQRQNSTGSYSNEMSSDIILSNFFGNLESNSNFHNQFNPTTHNNNNNEDGSSKVEDIDQTLNSIYTTAIPHTASSNEYRRTKNKRIVDVGGYSVDVDSILSGNTTIDSLNYTVGKNSKLFTTNDDDTDGNNNTSAVYGEDTILTIGSNEDNNQLNSFDADDDDDNQFCIAPSRNANIGANTATDSYVLNQNEFYDIIGGTYNSVNDQNNIFGNDNMINDHFYECSNSNNPQSSSHYVIAKPPGGNNSAVRVNANANSNDIIANVQHQQNNFSYSSNNHNFINNNHHTALTLDQLNNLSGYDNRFNHNIQQPFTNNNNSNNGPYINSHGLRYVSTSCNNNYINSNNNTNIIGGRRHHHHTSNGHSNRTSSSMHHVGSGGVRHTSLHRHRQSTSTHRRRLVDANDPQASIKRHNHNMLERKRRSELRCNFASLVNLIPELKGTAANRLSKVKILISATTHVRKLVANIDNFSRLENEKSKLITALREKLEYLSSIQQLNIDNVSE